MTTLVFMDSETTSLRHDRRAWEIAVITRRDGQPDHERVWYIATHELDLGNADPMSLKIGGFYQRHPEFTGEGWKVSDETDVLDEVENATRGATIVGAVPWFDTDVLGQRMRANGILPSWHYHLCDVETLAAGFLRQPPPWDFDGLLAAYGLEYAEADRHAALGDARMVRDLYDAVFAGTLVYSQSTAPLVLPGQPGGSPTPEGPVT